MTERVYVTPAPGSYDAVDAGCKCPVVDNSHGDGIPYPLGRRWYISERCPIHAPKGCYAPEVDPKRVSTSDTPNSA